MRGAPEGGEAPEDDEEGPDEGLLREGAVPSVPAPARA